MRSFIMRFALCVTIFVTCHPTTDTPLYFDKPRLESPIPYRCADELHITYTYEQGATERLDDFYACIAEKVTNVMHAPA